MPFQRCVNDRAWSPKRVIQQFIQNLVVSFCVKHQSLPCVAAGGAISAQLREDTRFWRLNSRSRGRRLSSGQRAEPKFAPEQFCEEGLSISWSSVLEIAWKLSDTVTVGLGFLCRLDRKQIVAKFYRHESFEQWCSTRNSVRRIKRKNAIQSVDRVFWQEANILSERLGIWFKGERFTWRHVTKLEKRKRQKYEKFNCTSWKCVAVFCVFLTWREIRSISRYFDGVKSILIAHL